MCYKRCSTRLVLLLWGSALLLSSCSCDTSGPGGDDGAGAFETVWSYDIPDGYLGGVQPVIVGGRAYVASDTTLSSRDLETGKEIWSVGLGNHPSTISSRKLLHGGGTLYLNNNDWVRAFDAASGERLWGTPIGFEAAIQIMGQNDSHLFIAGWNRVAALSKATGAIAWQTPLERPPPLDQYPPSAVIQQGYNPVATEERLYVATSYQIDGESFFRGNLFCYDTDTGAHRWTFSIPNHRVLLPGYADSLTTDAASLGAAISGDRVVFPAGQSVFALDRVTGQKLWETFYESDGFALDKSIAADRERAYAASTHGHVYTHDLETGERVWDTFTNGSITIFPVLHNEMLYQFDDGRGRLWAMDAATGEVRWHGYPPEHRNDDSYTFTSVPAVGEGMIVIVGSKRVYGLRAPE